MKGNSAAVAFSLSFILLCRYALAANVIHMTTSRNNSGVNVLSRDLKGNVLPRAAITADLLNNMTGGAAYLVNVKVGTPGQTLSLVIDTGSSDTFVLAKTDDQCNNLELIYVYGPCIGGTFSPSSSSTFTTIAAGGFKVKYVDGSTSNGDFISENLEIGGSLISALQMGLALHSTVGVGIMGIGYQTGESVSAKNRYPNLIDKLVAQKLINLRAYSLYLDDKETLSGSILFGGIDTEKFIGTLKVLPIQIDPLTKIIDDFIILMTSFSITDRSETSASINSSLSLPVILDSGTTLTYLPADLVSIVVSQLGAVDDTRYSQLIFVDCDWRTSRSDDFLSFGFGGSNGPVIRVPLSEFIRTLHGHYSNSPFSNTCDLGIRAAQSSIYLLGDTFLRSAYVVYDLDHNQIALAQTNFEAPGSQVHEIPSGASGIPLLAGQASGLTNIPESRFTTSKTSSSSRTPTHLDTTFSTKATLATTSSSISSIKSASPPVPSSTSTPTSTAVPPNTPMSTSTAVPTSSGAQIPTSVSISIFTQTLTSSASSATSKSSGVRIVPAFQKKPFVVLLLSILIALQGRFWFLMV